MAVIPDLATDAPLWLSLLTVATNAVVGAMLGHDDDTQEWDFVGVTAFALLMGLGGGFIRDVLLGHLPAESLRNPWYLTTVLAAAGFVVVLGRWVHRFGPVLVPLNAVALGLFAVTGAGAAHRVGLPAASGVLIGTISAVGGGVMVAVVRGRVPTILTASRPHALLAVLAAVLYVVLVAWNPTLAALIGVAGAVLAQLVVDRWNIRTSPLPRTPRAR